MAEERGRPDSGDRPEERGATLMEIAERISRRISWEYGLHIKRDPFTRALARWHDDKGDETHRLSYDLGPKSLVLDVGGFRGDWAAAIVERYDPYMHVFEPAVEFFAPLKDRFSANPKVRCHPYGLLDATVTRPFVVDGAGSTLYPPSAGAPAPVLASFVDVKELFGGEGITAVDLMKINIEGGEYPLLRRMIDAHLIERVRDLQIQFHRISPSSEALRNQLQTELSKTHRLTYDYFFVWENWRRLSDRRAG
jgi:FkbM family methyltransferase